MDRSSKYCTVGTAGHVDHGKTSLVKALTGVETDTLVEEKERGLSIELGFAHMTKAPDGMAITIIDVPGHERFLKTMLAGTSGIDIVLFVVEAKEGIMPQTREHLEIVSLLGIERALFVITKIDLASAERIKEVEAELKGLIKDSPLAGSSFFGVSSTTGAGLEELKAGLENICLSIEHKGVGPFFRLPVDRVFAIKGYGAVATGTIASGVVNSGDEVAFYPPLQAMTSTRVRGIESRRETVTKASVGMRTALNLKGVSVKELKRGNVITAPGLAGFLRSSFTKSTERLTAECAFSFSSTLEKPVKDGESVKLHHQTGETLATLRIASQKEVSAGDRLFGRLILKEPLLLLRDDRFIMRETSTGRTIGGGRVLLPYFNGKPVKRMKEVDYDNLSGDGVASMVRLLLGKKEIGVDIRGLDYILNISSGDIIENIDGFLLLADHLVDTSLLGKAEDAIEEITSAFHELKPELEGTSEADIAKSLKGDIRVSSELLTNIIKEMARRGELVQNGPYLSTPGHAPALSKEDEALEKALRALFAGEAGVVGKAEISSLLFKKEDIERVLAFDISNGTVVRLSLDRYYSSGALDNAKEKLLELFKEKQKVKASDFRDALGCGRKLAIEILEYFDRERVTLRDGDSRVLRGA